MSYIYMMFTSEGEGSENYMPNVNACIKYYYFWSGVKLGRGLKSEYVQTSFMMIKNLLHMRLNDDGSVF